LAGIDPNIIRAAKAVKPKPGYFDVLTHGSMTNPMIVVFRTGSAKGSPLNHRTLAVFMKSQGWRRGIKVRLLSCSTGNTGFAQNLANKLGVEVLAPMGRLKVYLGTGRLEVIDGLRSWKAFLPGRG
jgi:hypothetical protein